ncbi:hypothetical protein ACFQU2_08830 [Siccirubricoccus deserti]
MAEPAGEPGLRRLSGQEAVPGSALPVADETPSPTSTGRPSASAAAMAARPPREPGTSTGIAASRSGVAAAASSIGVASSSTAAASVPGSAAGSITRGAVPPEAARRPTMRAASCRSAASPARITA